MKKKPKGSQGKGKKPATGRARKKAEVPPIARMRGVVSFDTNEILVLVRAPVEAAAEAFMKHRKLKTWTKNASGKQVTISDPCYVVYRFKGHDWTIIDRYHGQKGFLRSEDAQTLSKALQTKAIHYGNSDTAGATSYDLFENGKRLEHFECFEGLKFESTIRDVGPPEDGPDIYPFVNAFMREQDAFAPSWPLYMAGWNCKPGDQVMLDFGDYLVDLSDGGEAEGVMERVDFVGA